jgi:hypothetical protein
MAENNDDLDKVEERLDKLNAFLASKRREWTNRIKGLAEDIREVSKLSDVTVYVSSYRAMLVENIAEIAVKVRQRYSSYYVNYKQSYHYYISRHDFKLTDKRIDIMIQADLRHKLEEIGQLEAQLEFYKECVKTLDQMAWGIKNKIAIENLV